MLLQVPMPADCGLSEADISVFLIQTETCTTARDPLHGQDQTTMI